MEENERSESLAPGLWMSQSDPQFVPDIVNYSGFIPQSSALHRQHTDNPTEQPNVYIGGNELAGTRQSSQPSSSSLFHQFGAYSVAEPHQKERSARPSQTVSDRSAWSHLLSLDPFFSSNPTKPPNEKSELSQIHQSQYLGFDKSPFHQEMTSSQLVGTNNSFSVNSSSVTSMNVQPLSHSSILSPVMSVDNSSQHFPTQISSASSHHLSSLLKLPRSTGALSSSCPPLASSGQFSSSHTSNQSSISGRAAKLVMRDPQSTLSSDSSSYLSAADAHFHGSRQVDYPPQDQPYLDSLDSQNSGVFQTAPISLTSSDGPHIQGTLPSSLAGFSSQPKDSGTCGSVPYMGKGNFQPAIPNHSSGTKKIVASTAFGDPPIPKAPPIMSSPEFTSWKTMHAPNDVCVTKNVTKRPSLLINSFDIKSSDVTNFNVLDTFSSSLTSHTEDRYTSSNGGHEMKLSSASSLLEPDCLPLDCSLETKIPLSTSSQEKTTTETKCFTFSDVPTNQSALSPFLSQKIHEKAKSPTKSTPKKSNFFGRDASLFSFTSTIPSGSLDQGARDTFEKPLLESNSFGTVPACEIPQSCNVMKDGNMLVKNAGSGASMELNEEPGSVDDSCVAMEVSGVAKSENVPSIIVSSAGAVDTAVVPLDAATLNASTAAVLPDATFTATYFGDGLTKLSEDIPVNEMDQDGRLQESTVSADAENKDSVAETESAVDEKLSDVAIVNDPELGMVIDTKEEGDDEQPINPEITEPVVTFLPMKGKIGKKRKRKATGAATRGRKKNVKLPKLATDATTLVPGETLLVSGESTEVNQPATTLKVRKKRGPAKAQKKASAEPRRSSSRRSKANAMRLIELQADSNYAYAAQTPEVEPVPQVTTRVRKRPIASLKEQSNDELSEIDEEHNETEEKADKDDGDYAVSEEEGLDPEEFSDEDKSKIKGAKVKRSGGLKISIKLGSDSSAAIVTGIKDSPKKSAKKKMVDKKLKKKGKMQVQKTEDNTEADKDVKNIVMDPAKPASDTVVAEKHESLMEKYFSTSTASSVKQTPSVLPKKAMKHGKGKAAQSKEVQMLKGTGATKDSEILPKDKNENEKSVLKFVCGYCPRRYQNKHELLTHMEAHMAEMEDKSTKSSPEALGKEKKSGLKSAEGPAPTKLSNKLLKKQGNEPTKVQVGKKGSSNEEPKFNCGECGESFLSKSVLLEHVRIHTAEKPFECNICHKCFKERDVLSAHRKIHAQDGLIRCHICSKGFIDSNELLNHMQSHPKRSANAPSLKKPNILLHKLEKGTDDKQGLQSNGKLNKGKQSFGFALGGETVSQTSKNLKNPSVILLKRGEGSSSTSVVAAKKEEAGKTEVSLSGSSSSQSKTPKQQTKEQDLQTSSTASTSIKQTASQPPSSQTKPSGDVVQTSEECTCKECPECVTRFLQSFE